MQYLPPITHTQYLYSKSYSFLLTIVSDLQYICNHAHTPVYVLALTPLRMFLCSYPFRNAVCLNLHSNLSTITYTHNNNFVFVLLSNLHKVSCLFLQLHLSKFNCSHTHDNTFVLMLFSYIKCVCMYTHTLMHLLVLILIIYIFPTWRLVVYLYLYPHFNKYVGTSNCNSLTTYSQTK